MTEETKVAAALVAVFFVGVALLAVGGGFFSAKYAAIFAGFTLAGGAIKLLVALLTNTRR